MSDLECPACGHAHNMGEYPDHMTDAVNNRFEFECAGCGAEFEVLIEWDPCFYPIEGTVRRKPAE